MALIPHNPSKRLHSRRHDEGHPDVYIEEVAAVDDRDDVEEPARPKATGRASALNRNVN